MDGNKLTIQEMSQIAMEATKLYYEILRSGQQANLNDLVQSMTQTYIESRSKVVEAVNAQSPYNSLESQFK